MLNLLRSGSGDAYEDIVQRRLVEGKAGNAGPLDQSAEKLVRITAAGNAKFLQPAQVPDLFYSNQIRQGRGVFHADTDRIVAVPVLDRFERAVQHLMSAEDHAYVVAERFGHPHIVSGKDD